MKNGKKIIVTMTSWKKRIQYVSKTIYMMERQSLIPDKIILNLSTDEFPNKEKELPKDLVLLADSLDNFEIYWVKTNTRAFKKFIPTLGRYFNEDCWILTVDDDYYYNRDYVSMMVETAEKYYPNCITPGICGLHPHGYAMIYSPDMFRNETIFKLTVPEMNTIIASDNWIQAALLTNGYDFVKVKSIVNFITPIERGNRLGAYYASRMQGIKRKEFIKNKMKSMGYTINFPN